MHIYIYTYILCLCYRSPCEFDCHVANRQGPEQKEVDWLPKRLRMAKEDIGLVHFSGEAPLSQPLGSLVVLRHLQGCK